MLAAFESVIARRRRGGRSAEDKRKGEKFGKEWRQLEKEKVIDVKALHAIKCCKTIKVIGKRARAFPFYLKLASRVEAAMPNNATAVRLVESVRQDAFSVQQFDGIFQCVSLSFIPLQVLRVYATLPAYCTASASCCMLYFVDHGNLREIVNKVSFPSHYFFCFRNICSATDPL